MISFTELELLQMRTSLEARRGCR